MEPVKRNKFTVYSWVHKTLKNVSPDISMKVCACVEDYVFNGRMPEAEGAVLALFMIMKPRIDFNNQKYLNGCKGGRPRKNAPKKAQKSQSVKTAKRSASSVKAGKEDKSCPSTILTDPDEIAAAIEELRQINIDNTDNFVTESAKSSLQSKKTQSHQANNTESDDNKKRIRYHRRRFVFVKPTITEIREYANSVQYEALNAEKFYDYYEAKGWRLGAAQMQDWQAVVRSWRRRDEEAGKVKPMRKVDIINGKEVTPSDWLKVLNRYELEDFFKDYRPNFSIHKMRDEGDYRGVLNVFDNEAERGVFAFPEEYKYPDRLNLE